jgi:ketosteroid isomerase-like protein
MPSDNVDVARRSFQAWNETGVEGSRRAGWTQDAEWHDPPGLPDAGVYRGADAVAARLEELSGLIPNQAEIIEATAVGEDEVLIIFGLHGEGGSSGVPVEQPMGCLIRITDGKVSRWRMFMSHEDAREAAGLSD